MCPLGHICSLTSPEVEDFFEICVCFLAVTDPNLENLSIAICFVDMTEGGFILCVYL